jgi:hypothetical protein
MVVDRRDAVPLPTALTRALDEHPTLAQLLAQMQASRRCLEAVADLLAPPLLRSIQAGPFAEGTWTLLAANGAVAAKLRQMTPLLERRLAGQGVQITAIRIRVQRSPPRVGGG